MQTIKYPFLHTLIINVYRKEIIIKKRKTTHLLSFVLAGIFTFSNIVTVYAANAKSPPTDENVIVAQDSEDALNIVNKDNKYSFSTISDKTSDTYGNATIVKNDDVYIISYSNIEEYKNAPDEKSDPKTTKPTETKPSTDNTTQHIKTDINGLLKNTKYTDDILKLQNSDSTKTISIALTGVKPGTRIEVFDHLFNQTVERDHDEFEMPCDYTSF